MIMPQNYRCSNEHTVKWISRNDLESKDAKERGGNKINRGNQVVIQLNYGKDFRCAVEMRANGSINLPVSGFAFRLT